MAKAYVVMAYIVMAHVGMAYVVMACGCEIGRDGPRRVSLYQRDRLPDRQVGVPAGHPPAARAEKRRKGRLRALHVHTS